MKGVLFAAVALEAKLRMSEFNAQFKEGTAHASLWMPTGQFSIGVPSERNGTCQPMDGRLSQERTGDQESPDRSEHAEKLVNFPDIHSLMQCSCEQLFAALALEAKLRMNEFKAQGCANRPGHLRRCR